MTVTRAEQDGEDSPWPPPVSPAGSRGRAPDQLYGAPAQVPLTRRHRPGETCSVGSSEIYHHIFSRSSVCVGIGSLLITPTPGTRRSPPTPGSSPLPPPYRDPSSASSSLRLRSWVSWPRRTGPFSRTASSLTPRCNFLAHCLKMFNTYHAGRIHSLTWRVPDLQETGDCESPPGPAHLLPKQQPQ